MGIRSATFFPGLFHLMIDRSSLAPEAIDRGLYAGRRMAAIPGGESRIALVQDDRRRGLGAASPTSFRLIVVLFVEPQINPIKHFPVVTISHKLLFPMSPTLEESFGHVRLDEAAAHLLAVHRHRQDPGIFGFLVWELKENWRLYRRQPAADAANGVARPSWRDDATLHEAGLSFGNAAEAVRQAPPGRTAGGRKSAIGDRPGVTWKSLRQWRRRSAGSRTGTARVRQR